MEALRFETVKQLRDIDEILKSDEGTPFQRIKDLPEPYRAYRIACEQLQSALNGRRVPLIIDTIEGRGLLWRLWSSQIGVVLIKNDHAEGTVTFLPGDTCISYVFDQIVTNPPKW